MNAQNILNKSKNLFVFIQFHFDCRNVFHINFDDVETIRQFNFLWQLECVSTSVFCFLQNIDIRVVCFNYFHEFVLHIVCCCNTLTQSVQTLCKIVQFVIDFHFFFDVSVLFTFECEFINFCVRSF